MTLFMKQFDVQFRRNEMKLYQQNMNLNSTGTNRSDDK